MLLRLQYLAIILILFSLNSAFGQSKSKEEVIDSLMIQCRNQGYFNGTVLVADEGEIILHKSYGLANIDPIENLELSDRFYIGSLTKQFTSALTFILQQEGALNIHHPIRLYLPEFDLPEYKGITIHHLLTHTSGLDNYTSFSDFDKSKDYSQEEFIEFIQRPLIAKPGTKWNYSNTGYYLLGVILERVSEKTFGELLDEKILSPLDMQNTGFDTTWITNQVAHGYYRTIEGFSPMPTYALSTLFSTGGMYSTAEDLFKWDQALYDNTLLTALTKSIMFTPIEDDYACGWYVKEGTDDDGNQYERHFHGGWIKGYHAFILRRIPQKQVVILLDNSYSQEVQTIKNRIWSALIEEELKPIKPQLSNLLFDACADSSLIDLIEDMTKDLEGYKLQYSFGEYDINKVGYRLMDVERYDEAYKLFEFNILVYPNSWNVYDSMGELERNLGNIEKAKALYKKSLELNPNNTSAMRALAEMASK
jgi:CubicO group peptidase (beta-lactamase class C family)